MIERRQVQDLPPWRLVVREQKVEQVPCRACQEMTRGTFPAEVRAPAQYGVRVRALAVSLHQAQFVPAERTGEALAEVCGCEISAGTLARWVQQAASVLKPTVLQIAEGILASPLQHGDETGVRVKGQLHWVQVQSTRWLTHLAWHRKRGREALEAIGIRPRFTGRSMRDRWASRERWRTPALGQTECDTTEGQQMQAGHHREGIDVQTRAHGPVIGGRGNRHLTPTIGRNHRVDLLQVGTSPVWWSFYPIFRGLETPSEEKNEMVLSR